MKTNLLQITLSMDRGGLERLVYDIIMHNEFSEEAFNIHLCCLDRGGVFYDRLTARNVSTSILQRKPVKIDLPLLRKLILYINNHRIEVVHSHSGCIFYAALAGRFGGARNIIHTEHGRYLPDSMTEILEDRICSHLIHHYVCVSEQLAKYMIETAKVRRDKIRVIMNGIDTDTFEPYERSKRRELRTKFGFDDNSIVLGTVCRLQPIKNVDFLIDWGKIYLPQFPNLTIMIVGDGTELAKLKRKREAIERGNVIFTGARDDIPDILNVFDIFVLPSYNEGTSLTILEAMSCELPVIVSDVGGNSTIVKDKVSGYLFPVNDYSVFQEKLKFLVCQQTLRRRLGREGRRYVTKYFNEHRMVEQYYDLYRNIHNYP